MTVPQQPGARVRARRGGSSWQVRVDRVDDLQRLAVASIGHRAVTEVEVEVRRWRPPVAGWIGDARLPGIKDLSVSTEDGGARAAIATAEPTDPGLVMAALVRLLRPVPRDEGPEMTFTAGLPASAGGLAGSMRDLLLDEDERDPHVRRCDVLLVGPRREPSVERAVTIRVGDSAWTRDDLTFDVCVDLSVHRPIGRRSTVEGVVATATTTGERVHVVTPSTRIQVDGWLTAAQVSALRSVDAVIGEIPSTVARQLNACGVLTATSREALPDADDPLAWQVASVHQRRHAMRQYSPAVALDSWPSVSVVMATHRPDHLEHAIRRLGCLRYPHLEIVIGAHGGAVDAARVWELVQDIPHPTTVVAVDGERTLGEALQILSDRATGVLLTKMDDDDHYGPEHIWDLVLARMYSGAQIVGKALDWIHVESADTTAFRPTYGAEKYADFVAGGTILISRGDLASAGGWRPVPKSVDRALLDRVLADGGLVYRTHGLGYVYVRHSAGHTASVRDEHFLTKTVATVPGLVRHECFGTGAVADPGAT